MLFFSELACDLGAMTSAQKFRGYMQNCLRWAATAQTDGDRHMLLQMAQTWEQAAQQIEQSVGLIAESRALLDRIGDVPPPPATVPRDRVTPADLSPRNAWADAKASR
jgi:hypothetical protein